MIILIINNAHKLYLSAQICGPDQGWEGQMSMHAKLKPSKKFIFLRWIVSPSTLRWVNVLCIKANEHVLNVAHHPWDTNRAVYCCQGNLEANTTILNLCTWKSSKGPLNVTAAELWMGLFYGFILWHCYRTARPTNHRNGACCMGFSIPIKQQHETLETASIPQG